MFISADLIAESEFRLENSRGNSRRVAELETRKNELAKNAVLLYLQTERDRS